MAGLNNVLDEVCITINNILTANNAGLSMGTYAPEGNKNAVMAGGAKEESCVCGACVMCKNATVDSVPVHILKDGKKVEVGGLAELNKKDILMDVPFAGCETTDDKICGVKAEDIEDGEWQGVDKARNQGKDKETLKSQSSYIVCMKGWGILYFVNAGQKVKSFADELSVFLDHLQEQFGFDRKTAGILGKVYRAIQEKYADRTQKERDWFFTRSLSQMGDYDNKEVFFFETHAWRRGAGWVYEYGVKNEKNFFCDILGIDEAEYKYIRQMVRLQHFMTSNSGYSYSSLLEMSKSSDDKIQEDFQNWKKTMEDGIGKESEKIKRRNIT